MRTVIDIPEADIPLLDQLSQQRQMSREDIVREAVSAYLGSQPEKADAPEKPKQGGQDIIDQAFGSWAEFPEDGLAYQLRMRAEWDR